MLKILSRFVYKVENSEMDQTFDETAPKDVIYDFRIDQKKKFFEIMCQYKI